MKPVNRRRPRLRGEGVTAALFAAPALAGLLLFVAVPFGLALGLSLTNLRMGSPLQTRFVGWQQYARVLADPTFQRAMLNNALFAAVVVPVQTTLALLLALAVNQRLRGMVVFRALFFMPVVFPMALVAVVWELIYAPGPNGPLNALLGLVTFGGVAPQDFLHDRLLALPAIMLMSIWQGVGFQMVVLLAGLQSIPNELYEAAATERAGRWSQFRHVTLPQLRNPLVFTALVTTVLAFRVFDQVQIMTRGGPLDATTTIMFEAVQAVFERQQVAQAAAMTVVFFFLVLMVTLVQRAAVRQEREVA